MTLSDQQQKDRQHRLGTGAGAVFLLGMIFPGMQTGEHAFLIGAACLVCGGLIWLGMLLEVYRPTADGSPGLPLSPSERF